MKTRRERRESDGFKFSENSESLRKFGVLCCMRRAAASSGLFVTPLIYISQGTRGGFRIDSLLARRREKKPVRPVANGESSFALSLRVGQVSGRPGFRSNEHDFDKIAALAYSVESEIQICTWIDGSGFGRWSV
jgi:hypothetical protein